jgi:hypothetical protein
MLCLPRKSQKTRFTSNHLAHSGYLHHSPRTVAARIAFGVASGDVALDAHQACGVEVGSADVSVSLVREDVIHGNPFSLKIARKLLLPDGVTLPQVFERLR